VHAAIELSVYLQWVKPPVHTQCARSSQLCRVLWFRSVQQSMQPLQHMHTPSWPSSPRPQATNRSQSAEEAAAVNTWKIIFVIEEQTACTACCGVISGLGAVCH
jgi:hypothetical protein